MKSNGNENPHLNRFANVPDVPPQGDEEIDGESYAMIGRGRQVPGLDFIWPDGKRDGFQYSQMMRRGYVAGKITLEVADFQPMLATITGRNLEALFDLIREQRCCKIRVAARDFDGDKEPVVTSITFEAVKEEE